MTLNLAKSTDWHEHDITELVFCRAGAGHLLLDRSDIELRPRRAIIIAPGIRHRFLLGDGDCAGVKIVCLRQDDVVLKLSAAQGAVLGRARANGGVYVDFAEQDAWLWSLVDRIPDTLGGDEGGEADLAWSLIGLLVSSAVRRPDILRPDVRGGHADKMRDVCVWIDANLSRSEKLDLIAARFGMSRSLLTREFRSFTGMSIVKYVNARRLQRAGTTLMASDKSILEVALELGFASLPNFYRQFKAFYGVTPAEFRDQLPGVSGSE